MSENPVVTIGICVNNGASTLREAVKSVIDQDFSHDKMEIVFVDDGSIDTTLTIMKDFESSIDIPVHIFHHKWKGLGFTRNVVVSIARGRYILWVDTDMILSKNYVKTMVDFVERNPDVGIAKGKLDLTVAGNWISALELFSRAASKALGFDRTDRNLKSVGTGGSIFRVDAVRNVGGFNIRLTGYGEDLDIENRIRSNGWKLQVIKTAFSDRERSKLTWGDLWYTYVKRGYDSFIMQKNIGSITLYKFIPPASFLTGFMYASFVYRVTRNKLAFALPLQHVFKSVAWCVGYFCAS